MFTICQLVQSIIVLHIIQEERNIMSKKFCFRNKEEDSSASLSELYESILNTMIENLYRSYKYRRDGMDEFTIYNLEKKIRSLLKDPERLFLLANNYREGTRWFHTIEANIASQDAKDIKKITKKHSGRSIESLNPCKSLTAIPYNELNSIKLEPILKQQNEANDVIIEDGTINFIEVIHQKPILKLEQRSDSESPKPEIDYTQFLKYRIAGIYKESSIKYITRFETYNIHFKNVFLKTMEGESYFQDFFVEMNRMEKENLEELLS